MRFTILGPRTDVATAEQVRAAREARGWTVVQMADAVGASPLEVSAWEAGAVAAPPLQAARVQWMLATDHWRAVTGAPGAPCGWMRSDAPHLLRAMPADLSGVTWYWNSPDVQTHFAGCASCQGRWRALERLGPLPLEPDASKFYTLRARFRRWGRRLPRWAQGPLDLLDEFGALTAFIVVCALLRPPPGIPSLVVGMGAGVAFWILGLRAIRVMGDDRHPLFRFGAGLLNGAMGCAVGMHYWHFFDPTAPVGDHRLWAGAAAVGVVTGLWSLRRTETAEASAPASAPPGPPPLDRLPGDRVPGTDAVPPATSSPLSETPVQR